MSGEAAVTLRGGWVGVCCVIAGLYVGTYFATRHYEGTHRGCLGASVSFSYRTWRGPSVTSYYYADWGPEGGPCRMFDHPGFPWVAFMVFSPMEDIEMIMRGQSRFAVLFRVQVTDWSPIRAQGG